MSISLKQRVKVLKNWTMFASMLSRKQISNGEMKLRLERNYFLHDSSQLLSISDFKMTFYADNKNPSLSWWDIAVFLSKIVMVTWWIFFTHSSRLLSIKTSLVFQIVGLDHHIVYSGIINVSNSPCYHCVAFPGSFKVSPTSEAVNATYVFSRKDLSR